MFLVSYFSALKKGPGLKVALVPVNIHDILVIRTHLIYDGWEVVRVSSMRGTTLVIPATAIRLRRPFHPVPLSPIGMGIGVGWCFVAHTVTKEWRRMPPSGDDEAVECFLHPSEERTIRELKRKLQDLDKTLAECEATTAC